MATRHLRSWGRPVAVPDNAPQDAPAPSPLIRYARAAIGPVGAAGAQFLLSLVMLTRLPVATFGGFAFLLVVAQLGLGVWGALFSSPLLVAAVQTRTTAGAHQLRALAATALLAQVPVAAAFFAIAWAVARDIPAAGLFAAFAVLLLTRQIGRTWHLAQGRPTRAMRSDLAYALTLIAATGALALAPNVDLRGAGAALLLAAAAGFPPLWTRGIVARARTLTPGDARAYHAIWRRDARWSLTGVVTTELTGNCHAWLVTALAGPAAFAPIAAAALLIRPVTVGVNALTEFERAHFARCFAARDLASAIRARTALHLMLLALWIATALSAALLMAFAPQALFHNKYPLPVLVTGTALWFAVALARSLHAPEGAILQAAGAFRQLAHISLVTCLISLAAVLALIAATGPIWSIAGIIAGEACFALALWRGASGWLAAGVRHGHTAHG